MSDSFRILFRCCELFGLHPYRNTVDYDHPKGATYSWSKNSSFWWCLIVFAIQVLGGGALLKAALESEANGGSIWKYPTLYVVLVYTIQAMNGVANFSPRIYSFRLSAYLTAIEQLKDFDNMNPAYQRTIETFNSHVRKRTLVVLVIFSFWAIVYTVLQILTCITLLGTDVLFTCLLIILQTISFSHVVISCLLYSAGVRSIAYRIRVIRSRFLDSFGRTNDGYNKWNDSLFRIIPLESKEATTFVEVLAEIKESLNCIINCAANFNHVYSVMGLIFFTCKLFTCSLYLYSSIFTIIKWSTFPSTGLVLMCCVINLIGDLWILVSVFVLSDGPAEEVKLLRKAIMQYNTKYLHCHEKAELSFLFQYTGSVNVALSACGLFSVGKHLIPGLLGSILTYMIIMLQNT